jgi:hypothetical protein
MERLAYIDHSLHQKTHSTFFIIDALKEFFDVEVFWDESWSGAPMINIRSLKESGYKHLAFCQMNHYDVNEIYAIGFESLITIPMYDSVYMATDEHWLKYKGYKVWSFSSALHERITSLGLESYYTQFIPDPEEFTPIEFRDSLRGFFWQRNDQITWKTIRKLAGNSNFELMRIHNAIDHVERWSFDTPTGDDVERFNISISTWFPRREDFQDYLNGCNIYFAPRFYEGIGKSFLEAMAKGMCVVAPNNGTMNEYIIDGETGLLWNPDNPEELDFCHAKQIARNAREFIEQERGKWLVKKADLGNFIFSNKHASSSLWDKTKSAVKKLFR